MSLITEAYLSGINLRQETARSPTVKHTNIPLFAYTRSIFNRNMALVQLGNFGQVSIKLGVEKLLLVGEMPSYDGKIRSEPWFRTSNR